jgi:hypothetical protein
MMLKTIAIVFGIIMFVVGVLGFVKEAAPGGMLLGIFHVNAEHNFVHILTGAASILCGITSIYASKLFFQIFGVIYGIVAVLGFYYGDQNILGLIANNQADSFLHIAIALFALYLGFGYRSKEVDTL